MRTLQPIKKVRAYIRLQNIKQKSNDLETAANKYVRSLDRFNEVDRAIVVYKISVKVKEEIESRKRESEADFLQTEKATDILKIV